MPAHAARTRTRPAPRHPRRVSGPLRPVPAAPAPAGPIRRGRGEAGGEPRRRETDGAFERIRALPDHRAVDRMLRSRAWIWLIGLGLLGIVAMQVSLLKLNTGISRAVTTMSTLERQNAQLEAEIGRLSSGERIRATAANEGMVTPPPGAVAFLTARPERDGRLAARRMQAPSDEAAAIMANGGREPGVLASAPLAPLDPATTAPVDPTTTTTAPVDPATTAAPVDPAGSAAPLVADPATG